MKIKIKTYAGEQIFAVENARVFFNRDCGKYGVETYGNLWNDCLGTRWQQVVLDTKHPYTPYKKVAERWLKKLVVAE